MHDASEYLSTAVEPLAAPRPGASGAEGIRTPDLLNAIQTLSQLSYSPRLLMIGRYSDRFRTIAGVELRGFEPLASSVRLMRSPN